MEILFAIALAAAFIYQVHNDFAFDSSWVCFSASAFLLSVALGIIFWHLTALNKKVEGVFCNSNLMLLHFLTFFCAATCDIIVGIVQSVNTKLLNEQDQKTKTPEVERLNIVIDVFTLLQTLIWDICQVIMLYVFVKFG